MFTKEDILRIEERGADLRQVENQVRRLTRHSGAWDKGPLQVSGAGGPRLLQKRRDPREMQVRSRLRRRVKDVQGYVLGS